MKKQNRKVSTRRATSVARRQKLSTGTRLFHLVMYIIPIMLGVLLALMLSDGQTSATSKVVVGGMFVAYAYLAVRIAVKGSLPKFTVESYAKK